MNLQFKNHFWKHTHQPLIQTIKKPPAERNLQFRSEHHWTCNSISILFLIPETRHYSRLYRLLDGVSGRRAVQARLYSGPKEISISYSATPCRDVHIGTSPCFPTQNDCRDAPARRVSKTRLKYSRYFQWCNQFRNILNKGTGLNLSQVPDTRVSLMIFDFCYRDEPLCTSATILYYKYISHIHPRPHSAKSLAKFKNNLLP